MHRPRRPVAATLAFAAVSLGIGVATLAPPAGAVLTTPAPTFTSTPPARTNATSATFEYDLHSAPAGICQLDGASVPGCDGSTTVTGLTNGTHTFTVRATYVESTSAPVSHTWTVDVTAPETRLTPVAGPAGELRLRLESERDARFQCKVVKPGSSGRWASCESPVTIALSGMSVGSYVDVRAVDRAGNVDPTPARWTASSR